MPILAYVCSLSLFLLAACGGDDADSLGVAAQCTATDECDSDNGQSCLLDFKGAIAALWTALTTLVAPTTLPALRMTMA